MHVNVYPCVCTSKCVCTCVSVLICQNHPHV